MTEIDKDNNRLEFLQDSVTAAEIISACGVTDDTICIICKNNGVCKNKPAPWFSCPEYVLDDEDPETVERVVISALTV